MKMQVGIGWKRRLKRNLFGDEVNLANSEEARDDHTPPSPIQASDENGFASDDKNATGPRGKRSLSDFYEECPSNLSPRSGGIGVEAKQASENNKGR